MAELSFLAYTHSNSTLIGYFIHKRIFLINEKVVVGRSNELEKRFR